MTYPCVAKDINAYLLYQYDNHENIYAIGSIERDRFIEVTENEKSIIMNALSLMNGNNTFSEINNAVKRITNAKFDSKKFFEILERADLTDTPQKKERKNEFERLGVKIFEADMTLLNKFFQKVRSTINPLFVVSLVSITISLVLCVLNLDYVTSISILSFENHYIRNIASAAAIMIISLIMHEMAHGVVALKYGIIPKSISITMYLYVSPIVYIKLPGMYTIKPIDRVKIWSAGVITNGLLFSIGIITSIICNEIGESQYIIEASNYLWYVNLIFIITNLCPLMPLDGYYIMATILKIPNLRKKSFALLKGGIKSKESDIKPTYLLYMFASILAMGGIVLKEIVSMVTVFFANYDSGIGTALWSVKNYIFMICFLIAIRIIRYRMLERSMV